MTKHIYILLAVFVLAFISYWNDFQIPMVYLPSHPVAAYGMYQFQNTAIVEIANTPTRLAGICLMTFPIVVFYAIFNKKLKKKFKKYSKDIKVDIKGIASNRTYHIYDRLTKDCINLKPDIIIMLIGVNDAWENYVPEDYPPLLRPMEPHVREIYRRIKKFSVFRTVFSCRNSFTNFYRTN